MSARGPVYLWLTFALALAAAGCAHTPKEGALTPRDEAALHLAREEWAQALPLLESLHQANPADLAVARDLVLAHVRTHRAVPLISRLEARTEKRPEPVTLYMLGLARFSLPAEAERALSDFRQAVALSPGEAELHFRLGLALLESERYPESLEPLQKARALAEDRRDILLPLAKARYRTGDRKGAVQALRTLVDRGPGPDEVEVAKALMEAIADPFARFPKSAQAKLEEGLVWLNDRDVPQRAIVAFEEILLDFPDLAPVHRLLGLAYQRVDDTGRAVEAFKRSIELAPEDGYGYLYLGLLYLGRQREEQAQVYFEDALERHPLLEEAWRAVGDHHLERRSLEKAAHAFSVLSHLQPGSPAARGKHALVLQLQGDFAAADRELKAILERDPENVEFMLRLGMLHSERQKAARTAGEKKAAAEEAERWLRKVLEAQPENALASRALQALRAQ